MVVLISSVFRTYRRRIKRNQREFIANENGKDSGHLKELSVSNGRNDTEIKVIKDQYTVTVDCLFYNDEDYSCETSNLNVTNQNLKIIKSQENTKI